MSVWILLLLLLLLYFISGVEIVNGCNEAVCASIVAKCILTDSCNCNKDTCFCCKQCFECLSFLYEECCSCFGFCPNKPSTKYSLYENSVIGDLDESLPGLFEKLTQDPDIYDRWSVHVYDQINYSNKAKQRKGRGVESEWSGHGMDNVTELVGDAKLVKENSKKSRSELSVQVAMKCTVAYMSECRSQSKCKQSCESIGASSYRWFFDGCCECIQDGCHYGLNDSKCSSCPVKNSKNPTEITELQGTSPITYDDYGQEDDEYVCDYTVHVCPKLS